MRAGADTRGMDLWIPITLAAALAQAIRFVLQKHLKSTRLSTGGATFARFLYSAPLAVGIAGTYAATSGQGLPLPAARFWIAAITGGTAQILATLCVVALFAHRNFAVGVTLSKTETLLSVGLGLAVLGDAVTLPALLAMAVALAGVVLLSDSGAVIGGPAWHRRLANRASGLGLLAGALFAVSAVGYRTASLSLPSGDAFLRASVTLACVTAFQLVAMALWLGWRQRGEIARVLAAWRVAGLVGLTSLVGSLCWFTAFTLQSVAYVKALGQIEVAFVLLASVAIFHETISRRELAGLALLTLGVVLLVLWG